MLKIVSPIPPSVNHYKGYRLFGRKIVTYTTEEAKKYMSDFTEYVIKEVDKQGWSLQPNKYQHFYVDMDFYFDRIDKDAGNYDKCLLDAITNTQKIWLDDNVVCPRVNRVLYDRENPRIEIKIYPVDYIGIFSDSDDLRKFKENNCDKCSKNKCAVLDAAIIGRLSSDIIDGTCQKIKNKK